MPYTRKFIRMLILPTLKLGHFLEQHTPMMSCPPPELLPLKIRPVPVPATIPPVIQAVR